VRHALRSGIDPSCCRRRSFVPRPLRSVPGSVPSGTGRTRADSAGAAAGIIRRRCLFHCLLLGAEPETFVLPHQLVVDFDVCALLCPSDGVRFIFTIHMGFRHRGAVRDRMGPAASRRLECWTIKAAPRRSALPPDSGPRLMISRRASCNRAASRSPHEGAIRIGVAERSRWTGGRAELPGPGPSDLLDIQRTAVGVPAVVPPQQRVSAVRRPVASTPPDVTYRGGDQTPDSGRVAQDHLRATRRPSIAPVRRGSFAIFASPSQPDRRRR